MENSEKEGTTIDAPSEFLNVLARNALGEKIAATPAFAKNALYMRTDKHLFAFAEDQGKR